jgi:tetratricopeptide (TPR) repeat protein
VVPTLQLHTPSFKRARVSRWLLYLGLIGLGAFVLRLVYLAELRHTPLFAVIIGDARQYDAWAQQIAGGQWIGKQGFYQTPLYPYLLAVSFKVFGHHVIVVRVIQAALGAASCVLLGLAGRLWFDLRVGLIAAALLAIYPPSIFFDGLIQKSSLDLFLMTSIVVTLARFHRRAHWSWLIVAGVALGLFTLNRENARVLYPIVIVWLLIGFRDRPLAKRTAWAAIFTAAIGIILLPVGLRNYHVGGEFLISTSQLGPNLYIGNHPGAQGSYEPLVPDHGNAAYEREDAKQLAESALGRKLSPSEISNYWFSRSVNYIRNQPGEWLRLMGQKLLLTFSAKEVVDTESIEAYSEYSRVLRGFLWLGFGVMLPLAVFGAWQTRNDWRRLWILYAMLAGFSAAVVIFYVVARYRYPLVPIVILFGAAGLAAIPSLWRQPKRHWLPGVIMAVAVAVPVNFLLPKSDDETMLNVGEELVRTGQPVEAILLLQKAVKESPNYAPAHFNLGVAFNQAGRKEEALEEFDSAIKLRPDYFDAQAAMALTLLETGRPLGAVKHFREAARIRPDMVGIHRDLGNALMRADKRPEAIAEYEAALKLDPNDAATHNSLAVALQQEKKFDEAIQQYEAALRLKPDDAGTRSNLALALDAKGNHEAAIDQFSRALQLQPDNAGIHTNFGDLLMRLGRTPDAILQYELAAKLASDSLEAQLQLAQAYVNAGRFDDAISKLEKALALARAGGALEQAAQIEQAISACRSRALSSKPQRPPRQP